ncbi:MAG TPA: efflux RND transporter periplasmic adaptor subunit, partial [Candidatus Eisenbacteria bacterium]
MGSRVQPLKAARRWLAAFLAEPNQRRKTMILESLADPRRRRQALMVAIGGVLVVLATTLIGAAMIQSNLGRVARIPAVKAKREPVTIKVTEIGELKAENQITISASNDKQILWLVPEGTLVKEGDRLVMFESEKYVISRSEAQSSLQVERANLVKAQNDLEAQKAREESAHQRFQSLSELAAKGFVTGGEVEQARLDYLELKSRTRSLRAGIDAADATVNRAASAVEQEERKLRAGVILAPRAGLVVYATSGSGEDQHKIATGMTPFEGMDLLYLPDVSSMLVETEINEVDLAKVRPGLEALISLDAYPGVKFRGEIRSVANLARRKLSHATGRPTGARVFDVTVKVLDQDPRLKPGLTATVDMIISDHERALVVPLEAVFYNDKDEPVIYVKHG